MTTTTAVSAHTLLHTATDNILGRDFVRIDHSVVRVPNLEEGVAFYRALFGLVEADRRHGRVYLASPVTGRIPLALTEGGTGLDYVSILTGGPAALDRLAGRLGEAGISYTRGTEDSRAGANDALRITLPTGHTVELLAANDAEPEGPAEGYVPGAFDVRTSHLQLRTFDVKGMEALLSSLGFQVSSYAVMPDDPDVHMLAFTRFNEFHHQVAVLTGEPGLHHVALELDDADFYKFLDHLAAARIKAEYGPGRHREGNMMFIYVRDPWGNRTEVTSQMEFVGLDYETHELHDDPEFHMNMWGPQPPPSWYTEWN